MLREVAWRDTTNKFHKRQPPAYAEIVRGWLDPRIVLVSSVDRETDWGRTTPDRFLGEVNDFLDQTVTTSNNDFGPRLICDKEAGRGCDESWEKLESILRRRREAATRIHSPHWHQESNSRVGKGKRAGARLPAVAEFPLFNDFPDDIRRLIFEIAFEDSNNSSIHLAFVSREIHSWYVRQHTLFVCRVKISNRIEPLIYRHVALRSFLFPRGVRVLVYTLLKGRKGKKHYTTLIQSISINRPVARVLGIDLLRLCDNRVGFAGSWPGCDINVLQSILKGDLFPRLQRLSLHDAALLDSFT